MNVLILDAYFEPETIAYTHLEKDLLEGLLKEGHRVTVLCPIPSRGVDKETAAKYPANTWETRESGKLRIFRFWAPREGRNPAIRAFRYFWCNFATWWFAGKITDADVIFSNSTPPTQGFLAGLLARHFQKKYGRPVKFYYHLQDIFPDSLVNAGLASEGGLIWRLGRWVENKTYSSAEQIMVISEGFRKNLEKKGVPADKVKVISNWIDLQSVRPVARGENHLIQEFGIDPAKFLVVYAGNFGEMQGAEILLDAAERLADDKQIQFVIFGGGPLFAQAKERAAQMENVIIHGLLPQSRISEVYSLGDLAFVCCKKGTGTAGMPSKAWSIMACDTPILASFDLESDLTDVIQRANAGVVIPPEDAAGIADAIADFKSKSNTALGGRRYAEKYASKEQCVYRILDTMGLQQPNKEG